MSDETTIGSDVEVLALWPVRVLRARLPDHERHDRELLAAATSGSSPDPLACGRGAGEWLRAHLERAVARHLAQVGGAEPAWMMRTRYSVHRFGGYRPPERGPGGSLRGRYTVSVPVRSDAVESRDDLLPCALSFYDPRPGMNMNAIRDDPYHGYNRTLRPGPGSLLLWPAFVPCFVHPNLSREPFVAVEIDVSPAFGEPVEPGTRALGQDDGGDDAPGGGSR